MDGIKQVLRDLAGVDLLRRFIHGKTQNSDESLNSVIWTRIHKTVFVRLDTLEFGIYYAVLCFNAGVARKSDVLNILGVRSGSSTVNALKQIDMESTWKAEIATLSIPIEERRNKRA
jgi:hypothetical protein